MSVDITAKNGAQMNMTNVAWRLVLEFGRGCGWQSLGTSRPDWHKENEPWDKSYDPAMGQHISSNDASALAEAVARGLGSRQLQDLLSRTAQSLDAHVARLGYNDDVKTRVSDRTIDMLRQFAELAKSSGGFRIE
jgi:hypothetical protein